MKTTIRQILLATSIGGSSVGIIMVAVDTVASRELTFYKVIGNSFVFTFFVYSLYAGLTFLKDLSNIEHLERAFIAQIPWITSPVVNFKIATGIGASFLLTCPPISGTYRLSVGAEYALSFLNEQTWGIGVNLAAISFLALIKLYKNKTLGHRGAQSSY
ncbi:hypothetical protein ACJJID_04840 [Microbulbifer sp. CnH-101-G]|uniref:hypothetical protein n=1 Tax=Microbulbifer sp. CnH-101-G TaxID=3243393 RepID=UPI004039C16E